MSAPIAFFCRADFERHDTGPGHPECPERIAAVRNAVSEAPLAGLEWHEDFAACDQDHMLACHDAAYLHRAEQDVLEGRGTLSTGDTQICPASWEVSQLAAGAATTAIDAVCQREYRHAFCAVRPPGHHATASKGMGFCLLNNVAIAARHAQRQHNIQRVLIVDWDVHHGNGTQDIFYEDGSVLFFSTHQSPLYPGTGGINETGAGEGAGLTINAPLPAGAGRQRVFAAFEKQLLPAVADFKPELVLISAGFDSRHGDPLGGMNLTDEDFFDLTQLMVQIADKFADGRLVSLLEGGYNLQGLASAVVAHLTALCGDNR